MRGVQNRTYRKTSSHPKEAPYKPRAPEPSTSINKGHCLKTSLANLHFPSFLD